MAKAGVDDVSASQIKRWQKLGLLPEARRRGRGRGRGSRSSFPPGTVDHVRALRAFLAGHRNLDKVAVLLKLNGYQVSAAALARATRHLVFDEIEKLDRKGERTWLHPHEISSSAARTAVNKRARTDDDNEVASTTSSKRAAGKHSSATTGRH
jgi:hypothetical protein